MLLRQSNRAVTLKGVWSSSEASFKKMESDYDKGITKGTLVIEVAKMVNVLKADMQEVHIDYFIGYLLQHYFSYTISDITCLTDRLVKNNPYGKPILQNLIHELDQYSIERQEYAVSMRSKENSQHKADSTEETAFTKMYGRLKQKAKEPVKTQKQKDAEAIAANNARIEQMKLQGLI
jgi:hypothetical protein